MLNRLLEKNSPIEYLGYGIVTVSDVIFIFVHKERVDDGTIYFESSASTWVEIKNDSTYPVNLATFARDLLYNYVHTSLPKICSWYI